MLGSKREQIRNAVSNAVQILFRDGGATEQVEVEYPVGHRRRRAEGLPLLAKKSQANAANWFPRERVEKLRALFEEVNRLEDMAVDEFAAIFVTRS